MLKFRAGNTAIATATEVRDNLKGVFEEAQHARVYVTNKGKVLGGIVSPGMMELLDALLADHEQDLRMAETAERRLEAIRSGQMRLLDEDEFWMRAGLED